MQDTSKDKWMIYGLDQPFTESEPLKLHDIFEHSLGHDTESSAIARAETLAAQNLDPASSSSGSSTLPSPHPASASTTKTKPA